MLGCATALPPHYYSQEDLLQGLEQLWREQHYNGQRLRQFHQAMGIAGRHLSLPREDYLKASDFSQRNRAFAQVSLELAERVVSDLLNQSQVCAEQIDFLVYTSVTGLSVPSLDAQLMNRLPFRLDLRRLPLFGLGCLGGAAGTARLADLLKGKPQSHGILLSVELCSLTLQPQDLSAANLVASGLFGDGAAALLMGPAASGRPAVVDTRSVFFPNSQEVMGWNIGSHGFSIVLSPQVPHYAQEHLGPALVQFLEDHQLSPADIKAWVAHPGGPKVVDALQQALGLPTESLRTTRDSLQKVGNLSSASVLFILAEVLKRDYRPGDYGLMLAMGPAFCAELVLLKW
ncbi:MAG: type III polyketide synthase [Candidatus Eremiobacteraeota bacterium]|nr:type III polyketide synthase [Candidatus Eremiobacteraeota bacterium]MCW5870973.1 type III polyketide synthase [Candidatus Eremiobacteraeota bacterium]